MSLDFEVLPCHHFALRLCLWMYRFERRTDRTRVCSRQRDRGVLPGFVRPLAAPRRLFVVWTRSLQDLPPGFGRFLRPRTWAASLRDILRAAPSLIGIGTFHQLKLNHTVGSLNFSERTGSVARRRYKIFLLYLKRPALVCLLALRLPMVRKRAGWVLTL
jgi:hypothetical protein